MSETRTNDQLGLARMPLGDVLEAVAAKTPTPGGGAVASITAALAASLARMVVNYSIGKKSLSDHASLHKTALESLDDAGRRALVLAEADARAYGRLNELWKLDAADERRVREFPQAVRAAIDPPLDVLNLALEMLRLMRELAGRTSAQLRSDLAVAAVLAEAAARAAAWNVRINLPLLNEPARAAEIESSLRNLLDDAVQTTREVEGACTRS